MEPAVFLARLRRRLRVLLVCTAAARLLQILVLLILAALCTDAIWHLPAGIRLLWLLGILLALVLILRRRSEPLRRLRMDDRDLARFVEQRRPVLDGALIAVVAGRVPDARDRARLEAELHPGVVRELAPAPRLPRLLAAAGAAVVLMVVLMTVFPQEARLAGLRLATPWVERPWPRQDAIELRSLAPAVATDEPVQLQAQRLRGDARQLVVDWRSTDGRNGRLSAMIDGDRWQLRSRLPRGRYHFTARAGDAAPAETSVIVRRRPELVTVTVTVTPPDYVPGGARQVPALAIEALPGSTIAMQLQAAADGGQPVARMQAELDDEPVALEDLPGGGHRLAIPMQQQDRRLRIHATDAAGIAMHPVTHQLRVRPDAAPMVRLTGPRPGAAVRPGAMVDVRVHAEDDVALAEAAVQLRRLPAGGADPVDTEDFITLRDLQVGTAMRDLRRDLALSLPEDLEPGRQIQLRAMAMDGDTVSGPKQGLSAVLTLRVVSEPELRRELERAIAAERDRVDHARSRWQRVLADADDPDLESGRSELASQGKRIAEALEHLTRRWEDNRLPTSEADALRRGAGLMREEVLAALPSVQDRSDGSAVEQALQQTYELLDGMLASGNLRRDLGKLIEQQEELNATTREQVREALLGQRDPAELAELAQRQRELATRQRSWEQRVVQDPQHAQSPVGTGVRQGSAARDLQEAADTLEQGQRKQDAVSAQRQATERMQHWYSTLREEDDQQGGGSSDDDDLVQALDALVAAHRAVSGELDAGAPTASQQPEWARIRERTGQLTAAIGSLGLESAVVSMGLAARVQEQVASDLGQGRRDAAGMGILEAIGYIEAARDAVRERDESGDVMALLRRLHAQQQRLVGSIAELVERVAADDLGFRDRERAGDMPELQRLIGDVLEQQVRPQVSDNAIV
ncbi:MAG: hypothetical protein ACOCXJ_03320, partial [Planctomycetota bacterium]